jgi:hypothetical protein
MADKGTPFIRRFAFWNADTNTPIRMRSTGN